MPIVNFISAYTDKVFYQTVTVSIYVQSDRGQVHLHYLLLIQKMSSMFSTAGAYCLGDAKASDTH